MLILVELLIILVYLGVAQVKIDVLAKLVIKKSKKKNFQFYFLVRPLRLGWRDH